MKKEEKKLKQIICLSIVLRGLHIISKYLWLAFVFLTFAKSIDISFGIFFIVLTGGFHIITFIFLKDLIRYIKNEIKEKEDYYSSVEDVVKDLVRGEIVLTDNFNGKGLIVFKENMLIISDLSENKKIHTKNLREEDATISKEIEKLKDQGMKFFRNDGSFSVSMSVIEKEIDN